jgi:hypothetical protein
MWSYEVAEHIHPRYARHLVATLTRAPLVIISAAQPGQGGEGHLNEQPLSYWRSLFEERGFMLDEPATAELHALPDEFARNMMVYSCFKESLVRSATA